jgi:FtsZ-binding cell division protein ZapB
VLDEMKTKFEKMKNFNNELIDRLEDLQHENKNLKDVKNGFKDQMINLEMKLGKERK